MKNIILSYSIFLFFISAIFSQDTTYVNCPDAYYGYYAEFEDYYFSAYTVYLGDESSLQVIDKPDWVNVDFLLDTSDWGTDVILTGHPDFGDNGLNQVTVGWFEINLDTMEEELWHVYIFNIQVGLLCCNAPESCNYLPEECSLEVDTVCLYEVECYVDPCVVETCPAYPEAECVADYCGGCYARFYVDGFLVDCDSPAPEIILTWEDAPQTVILNSQGNHFYLSMENPMRTSGYILYFTVNPQDAIVIEDIIPTGRTQHIPSSWLYNEDENEYVLLQFNLGQSISPGSGPVLEFIFSAADQAGVAMVEITSFNIGDWDNPWSVPVVVYPGHLEIQVTGCPLPGDVNEDDILNILDIILTVNCIMDNTPENCSYGEMNGDGILDVTDLVQMVNVILSGPSLPEQCTLEPDIGPCDGVCPRYFFNPETEQCEEFIWGCCEGVVPFETMDECIQLCE